MPHSPEESADSDDVFNTTLAHVHFGPVLSPEKRMSRALAAQDNLSLDQPMPLRRSPRLSGGQPSIATEGEGEEGDITTGGQDAVQVPRPTTPDQDQPLDGAYLLSLTHRI
jgi:hypothetical protein